MVCWVGRRLIETVPYNKFITLFVLNGEIFAKITLDETYFLPKFHNFVHLLSIVLNIFIFAWKWIPGRVNGIHLQMGIFWNITSQMSFRREFPKG